MNRNVRKKKKRVASPSLSYLHDYTNICVIAIVKVSNRSTQNLLKYPQWTYMDYYNVILHALE